MLYASIIILLAFSLLAFWKPLVPLFMIIGGISLMLGLYWFDVFNNSIGLAISLILIAYSFFSIGYAIKVALWEGGE